MSDEPKRFDSVIEMLTHDCHKYALENERLKAEVERLNAVIESHKDAGKRLLAMLDEERRLTKHIKAEVERLRKAGDKLVEVIQEMDVIIDMDSDHPEVKAWNAAKEGKPNA